VKRIALVALSVLVVACSNDSPTAPEAPSPPRPAPQATPERLLSDRAIEIDPTDLSLLSDSDERATGTYRYRIERTGTPVPAVDDYLIGETEDGEVYLRRVIAVRVDGNVVTTETEEAFWPEVVNGGRYTVSIPLDGSDPDVEMSIISGPDASIIPVASFDNGFDVSLDLCQPLGDVLPLPSSVANLSLCDITSACLKASASSPPPGPSIGATVCGKLTRLEPTIALHVKGTIDVVIDVDPGTLIPYTPPSVTEVSLSGNPSIQTTLGLGIGVDGSVTLTLVPIGLQYKKSIGKFGDFELVLGPQINLSVEGSADFDMAVDVNGGTNFIAGWRGGALFQFTTSMDAQPSFQLTSSQLTMKALGGIGVSAEFTANEKEDSKKSFAKLTGGFEVGIGAGVQQVNSRPFACTYLDAPLPGAGDCTLDGWRRDRDVVWEWGAAAFFGYKFGPISGGVNVGVPLGGGKIKDLRDVFGRGDVVVDVTDQQPHPTPKTFVGYPYDTCGNSGADPCEADLLLTRMIPGRYRFLYGVPRDSLDPIAEAINSIPVTQAPPFSQSIASAAGLFTQIPPPTDCVVDRSRTRTDCTLPAGIPHALWIRGVAPNCVVTDARAADGGSALPGNDFYTVVTPQPDAQIHAALELVCGDTALEFGELEVHVSTTGQTIDPDGYVVSVDGVVLGGLAPNDVLLVGGLQAEDKTVMLGDVAPNCSVAPPGASRSVTVPAGGTAVVTFMVDCIDPTVLGQVDIVTTTSGQDIPSGYTVDVAGQQLAIPANGSLTVSTPAGPTDVRLTAVPASCSVAAPNPRTVTVSTTPIQTAFDIDCKNAGAASKTAVSGVMSILGVAIQGTEQGSSANVRHVVDEVLDVQLSGGIVATGTLTRSYNLNGGDGAMSGTLTLDATLNGATGAITGTFAGNVKGGSISVTVAGGGSGALEGLSFSLDLSGPFDGPFVYDGQVQNPNKQGASSSGG